MSRRKSTFNESFERALTAAEKTDDKKPSTVVRGSQKNEVCRRFIGEAQIDLKYKGVRKAPSGAIVPWYIALISVGKIRHKISLGAPPNWCKEYKTPLDDGLVDVLVQSAIHYSLDEDDDSVSDDVTDVVTQATLKVRQPNGEYQVRKTI